MRLDPKRGIVTLRAALPRGMRAQGFADLVAQYRHAATARRLLAEAESAPPPGPAG